MNTSEFLETLDPTSRALSAHRMGLAPGSARFLAIRATSDAGAAVLARRVRDVGAGLLLQRLIERGGLAIPRDARLEGEAARLRDWFPLIETGETWAVPEDLALALLPHADFEAFWAASLVSRLLPAQRGRLAAALGVKLDGRPVNALRSLIQAVASTPTPASSQKLAEATVRLGRIRANDITQVEARVEDGFVVFTVRVGDDRVHEVVCEELCAKLGLRPADDLPQRSRSAAARSSSQRLPLSVRAGALVGFSTVRSADEALREPDFRDLVLHRVDERNVLLRAEVQPESAMRLLQRMGFALTELATG